MTPYALLHVAIDMSQLRNLQAMRGAASPGLSDCDDHGAFAAWDICGHICNTAASTLSLAQNLSTLCLS